MTGRVEALKALQSAADAGCSGLTRRWPALCGVVVACTRPQRDGVPQASPQRRQLQGQHWHQQHHTEPDRWTPKQDGLVGGASGSPTKQAARFATAPGASAKHDVNEQCALQALRLLAAVLAHLSIGLAPSRADTPSAPGTAGTAKLAAMERKRGRNLASPTSANGSALAAPATAEAATGRKNGGLSKTSGAGLHNLSELQPEADADALSTAVRAWQDACTCVLPDAVVNASAATRAAGIAAVAGLAPDVHGAMSPATKALLWQWTTAAMRDDATTVRAAAARAAAALALVVVLPNHAAGNQAPHDNSLIQIVTLCRL